MIAAVHHLAAFVLVAAIVIVTPGPDTALTIRNALRGGRRGGISTSAGVATGQATWALAASLGLAAVLSASHPAFVALRLAGSAYLGYLGLCSLRRAAGHGRQGEKKPGRREVKPTSAYRQGLLSNLGNPKMAVFFVSLIPQFAGHGRDSFAAMLGLGLVFAALTFIWLSGYATVVARARHALRGTRVRRLLDVTTGAALVALGMRVAVD